MLPQATRVLMEGAPIDLEFDRLIEDVEAIEGVEGIHHVHIWQLDEQHRAMEAHVSISRDRAGQLDALKHRVKQLLIEKCEIRHSTLEFEFVDPSPHRCHDTAVLPEH